MLRVHFTAEDLLRVSFAPEPAPLMELGFAVAVMRRQDTPAVLRRWQHRAHAAFPDGARPLLDLIPPSARSPLFLDPLSSGLEDGLDTVLRTPSDRVRAELDRRVPDVLAPTPWLRRFADGDREAWTDLERAVRSAYAGLLAEAWPSVRAAFDAERAWTTKLLGQYGIRATLAGLWPGGRWEGTVLVYDEVGGRGAAVDAVLSGCGLVLLPSTLWTGRPMISRHEDAPGILLYPAAAPLPLHEQRAALSDGERGGPLGALLGRTRAAALELLVRQRTTSDLARELDISKSSASEHAKALRDARLITTQRDGKAVRHECTPLGLELLTGAGAETVTSWR